MFVLQVVTIESNVQVLNKSDHNIGFPLDFSRLLMGYLVYFIQQYCISPFCYGDSLQQCLVCFIKKA